MYQVIRFRMKRRDVAPEEFLRTEKLGAVYNRKTQEYICVDYDDPSDKFNISFFDKNFHLLDRKIHTDCRVNEPPVNPGYSAYDIIEKFFYDYDDFGCDTLGYNRLKQYDLDDRSIIHPMYLDVACNSYWQAIESRLTKQEKDCIYSPSLFDIVTRFYEHAIYCPGLLSKQNTPSKEHIKILFQAIIECIDINELSAMSSNICNFDIYDKQKVLDSNTTNKTKAISSIKDVCSMEILDDDVINMIRENDYEKYNLRMLGRYADISSVKIFQDIIKIWIRLLDEYRIKIDMTRVIHLGDKEKIETIKIMKNMSKILNVNKYIAAYIMGVPLEDLFI